MSLTVYTASDVGRILARPADWVVDQALAGVIPGRKVGRYWRFTEDDVRAYLDSVSTAKQTTARTIRRRRSA